MSNHTFTIHIPGDPIPEGSVRAYIQGKRAVIIHDKNTKLQQWRTRIASAIYNAAFQNGWELPLDEPIKISAHFTLRKPKTVKRDHPSVKPDLDKLARAVGDALGNKTPHQTLAEDSRIVAWELSKTYGEPGVTITIERNPTYIPR